jgi:predicted DNA-binding transcriptional regulator YafY
MPGSTGSDAVPFLYNSEILGIGGSMAKASSPMKFKRKAKQKPARESTMTRLGRVLTFLVKLDHGTIHVPTLARELGVAEKTIQRDMHALEDAGFEVVRVDNGCYKLREDVSLKARPLSREQNVALVSLSTFAKHLGAGLSESFENLFRHITGNSPWESNIIPVMPRLHTDQIPYSKEIDDAIEDGYRIELKYRSTEGKTVVHNIRPLKILVNVEGFAYIFAYQLDKKIFYKYRIDRIESLEVMVGETVRQPSGVDEALAKARSVWGVGADEDRKIKIRLKIEGPAREYFLRQEIIGGQKITAQKEGSLIYDAVVCHFPEIIPHILRWMPDVTVVAPPALQKEVLAKLGAFKRKQA